ncbi:3-hydroxybutyrate dehydrogenase [Intrasporangium oryzae NRRL B-24470]|uniref:3-hydroxybutyrate dehydrogenase n=1 Tax=Intrasporangium oryzae NRRL B-24470 TaxID=1386089 RepID=W9GAN8_9MICO|nr:3-hydroxybutyrate dehydrogenase [Intrasporangium oryzae]EWT01898.1 3-hydroxybutyrate dehydrogenase [Intrasporangium oryzae NRRL B-24470]
MADARTAARDDVRDAATDELTRPAAIRVNERIELTGRTALVTGAASGIGAAVAHALAAAGAAVHAVDRDEVGLAELARCPGITATTADLSDLDGLAALPTEVDILVNNAGVQHVSPIEDFPLEKIDFILDLMLVAPFRLIRQTLPHMYAQGWGRVVNVSSVHGLRASAFKSAYVTAKHGLEGLSKVVALEGGPRGVTSNCINPAYVRTPLVEKQVADQARAHGIPAAEVVETIMLSPVAVKRLVEPEEVAALALFLCGPASASVNGTSFAMDGGWTAH